MKAKLKWLSIPIVAILLATLLVVVLPLPAFAQIPNITVKFERTRESPVDATFRATITNLINSPIKDLTMIVLLEELSLPIASLKFIRVEIITKIAYTYNVPVYGWRPLTEEEKQQYIDMGLVPPAQVWDVVSYTPETRYREEKKAYKDWYFKGATPKTEALVTIPASGTDKSGFGYGTLVLDFTINTGTILRSGLGWGSSGILALDLGGTKYLDKVNSSWWNSNWTHRRKLTINNSTVSEALTDFPILVKLNSTRIDYAYTQNSGQDIRFVDSDDVTALKHEIEKWDETGTSWVWVKVPNIPASANTDFIWMYYGNATVADGQDATNVWEASAKGVWHLKEASGTLYDSTANANSGTPYPVSFDQGSVAITSCESLTDWTGTSLSLDADKREGTYALKDTVASPVVSTNYITSYNPAGTWNLGTRNLNFWFKSDRANTAFTSARVYIYDSIGNWRYHNLTFSANAWRGNNLGIASGGTTSVTPPDKATIDRIEWQFVAADTTAFYKLIDIVSADGSLLQGQSGQIDGAPRFSGTVDHVNAGSGASLNFSAAGQMTAVVSVKFSGFNDDTGRNIPMGKAAGSSGWILHIQWTVPRKVAVYNPNGWAGVVSVSSVIIDTWHRVVISYNNQIVRIYLDGQFDKEGTAGTFVNDTSGALKIGGWGDPYVSINGLEDEVRLYNEAKSAQWIKADYLTQADTYVTYGTEEYVPAEPPTGFTLKQIADYQVDANWTLGVGNTNVMLRRKLGSYPTSITDGELVYQGSGTSKSDTADNVGLELDKYTYYYRIWGQNALGSWSDPAEGKIGGEGMVMLGFIILALGLTVATFALKSGRRILAFASAGAWMLLGVYSYTRFIDLWDIYYALFWLSMGMVFVCVLIPAVLREKKEEDIIVEDIDEYGDRELLTDIEAGEKDRERLDKLFGTRKHRPRRLSKFARTGKE